MAQKSQITPYARHTTGNPDTEQIQNNIENSLRSIEACSLVDGHLLQGVDLASGDNEVGHKLDREIKGWIITRYKEATANVYEKISDNNSTNSLLLLNSSAATTVDIWVF